MADLYQDISSNDICIWSCGEVSGNENDLGKAILDRQADLVVLADASRASVQRLERLGIPLVASTAATLWRRKSARFGTAESASWSTEPHDWVGMDELALAASFSGPLLATSDANRFLICNGRAIAKSNSPGGLMEVVNRSLDANEIADLLTALDDNPGPAATFLLPNARIEVAQAIAAVDFLPVKLLERHILAPFLNYSTSPPLIRPFAVTAADVDAFGRQSGDMNPLHFDDEFAVARGFDRRISHGMIFNGWLTKLLGTEYPGPGTIFLRNTATYHAPVYPGETYEVRISTPMANDAKGLYHIVAQLRDSAGKLATLSYNDVMYRPPGRPA